jgi:hypothetical protein
MSQVHEKSDENFRCAAQNILKSAKQRILCVLRARLFGVSIFPTNYTKVIIRAYQIPTKVGDSLSNLQLIYALCFD